MSWVVTSVATVVGTQVYAQTEAKKARKQAKKDANQAEKRARAAEVFAETEGQGVGSQAEISLGADTLSDEDLRIRRGSTLRI